jgi:cysteine synthase
MYDANARRKEEFRPEEPSNRLTIGRTPLICLKNFAQKNGVKKILVKDESKNTSGTYKDRRSAAIVKYSIENQIHSIVLITAGNAGYSLSNALRGTYIKLFNIVDLNTNDLIKKRLTSTNSKVIEIDLSKAILTSEDLIGLVDSRNRQGILDGSNGFSAAYESIFYEVEEECADYIVTPFGSGEAFLGLTDAIRKKHSGTKVIGVRVKDRVNSYAKKLCTIWTPYEGLLMDAEKKGHQIIRLDEDEIASSYEIAEEFVDCEPSSGVVFEVFKKVKFEKNSTIILINSGKGLY